ncbi:hypothetical protein B566_EDAN010245 [Ephemera danica]|nr:hypothetical protein B566_EDAN010245 [Ephemera danica]
MEFCVSVNLCANCENGGLQDIFCILPYKALCSKTIVANAISTTQTMVNISIVGKEKSEGPTYSPGSRAILNFRDSCEKKLKKCLPQMGNISMVGKEKPNGPTYSPGSRAALLTFRDSCEKKLKKCIPKNIPKEKDKMIDYQKSRNMLFLNECAGKQFFISKTKVVSVWIDCCNVGLVPAEYRTKEELDCVRKNANNVTGLVGSVTVFTAYSDAKLDRKFISCLSNFPLPDYLWISGQPDNKADQKSRNMLFLNECAGKMFFITKKKGASNWVDCCNVGLIPAEFRTKEELDCVRKNANNVTGQ